MTEQIAPPLQPADTPTDAAELSLLRPGALAKLHDPSPEWASGLSDDFLQGSYGRNWREVV